MTEKSIPNRMLFPQGGQRRFIGRVAASLSVAQMANLCRCSERTIRDWKREKFSMPAESARKLSRLARVPLPASVRTIPAYAHTSEAGKKGGAAVIKKYGRVPGDPAHRASRRKEWWETEGKYTTALSTAPRPIQRPRKSKLLAEYIGIAMGDGGLSKYQVIVSLNTTDDDAYILFVSDMMQRLFEISPSMYPSKTSNVTDIVISRSPLVSYLHGLGLPIGDKIRQGLDIPDWIRQTRPFSLACVRGLIDTDGCIFTHRYRVKGKWYAYKKLQFTSASPPLIQSVYEILDDIGLKPRRSRGGRDIYLDSIKSLQTYLKVIGTNNPKHLKRYQSEVG